MKFAAIEELLLIPFTPSVRRGAILAGIVSAVPTGGIPLADFGPAFAMGRMVPLIAPAAFALHLGLAIVYGVFLSLVIGRVRGWWTLGAMSAATLLIYFGNAWLMKAWHFPTESSGSVAAAHLLFAFVFTIFFKLQQADAPELNRNPASNA